MNGRARAVGSLAAAIALIVAIRAVLADRACRRMKPIPGDLIAAVPPELRSQPVLNGYAMGGPLILSGIRPVYRRARRHVRR